MPRVKRAHYFTKQFPTESDFNDEQSYRVKMRCRHNGGLHAWGVASGLEVTRAAARQVLISSGLAIDALGRELVIEEPLTPPAFGSLGNDVDIYVTLAYGETTDPLDHYTDGGVDDFVRTVEEPRVTFSTAVPPADGSVILLARIHLNGGGNIEANSSINPSVRPLASAQIAPKAIGTGQLADNAITLQKLVHDVQPLTVVAANAITVTTDDGARKLTIGESHSALTGNPHHTTAADIDTEGGTNQIVARINAGAGIIARTRLEPALPTMVSGVITFRQLPVNLEMFSDFIDAGLGVGALSIQLAIEDLPTAGTIFAGDETYLPRPFRYRTEVNKSTGQFKVFITQNFGGAVRDVRVRWFAFKGQPVPDENVEIGVVVTPPVVNLLSVRTQNFTASVTHATNQAVNWTAPDGGHVSSTTGATVNFNPAPLDQAAARVIAAAQANTAKSATASINVTNAIVTVNPPSVSMLPTQQIQLTASVSATNQGLAWSVSPTSGGTVAPTSGLTTTFTPAGPGSCTVRAVPAADQSKFYDCPIVVTNLTIAISNPDTRVEIGEQVQYTADVNWPAEKRATWVCTGGTITPGPRVTAAYTAPVTPGTYQITAKSVADPSKSTTINIDVLPIGGGAEKLLPNEGVDDVPPAGIDSLAPASKASSAGKARSFITPRKRPR